MLAFLGNRARELGQMALAVTAGLSLLAVCAAALAGTLICAAPLRLLQAKV